MISIPFSNIFAWADKPKPMNEASFKKKKDELSKTVEAMLKEGRSIY